MAQDFDGFKKASESTLDWLKSEYSGIRTSSATPSILDGVSVEVYGSKMSINQMASILIAGPKSLLITPWDKALVPDIYRAIRESNLGLSVALDGQGVRVSFPELTSERRAVLIKVMKEKYEEARIRVRTEREKNLNDLDRKEKEGSLSKDDKFRLKAELQKLVDDVNGRLDELGLGFPPRANELFTWKGTPFTLNWLPFGGFVKIFGENPENIATNNNLEVRLPSDSFQSKNRGIQASVLVAGGVGNFLFAGLLISLGFMIGLPAPANLSLPVENPHTVITTVLPESPAALAGLKSGDT